MFLIPQPLGPGGDLFRSCDFSKKSMVTYVTQFSRWKFSQKKSIFSKVRKPSKWTLPRRKHLFLGTENCPKPNCHRRTVFFRDWIFRDFGHILSLKNPKWALSEPSPNWAKSHWHEPPPFIAALDTRQCGETIEKIIWKRVSNLWRFLFFHQIWWNECWLPGSGRLSAHEQSRNEGLYRRHGPCASSLVFTRKSQANAPPVGPATVELGWLKNGKNRRKMPKITKISLFSK